MRSDRLIAWIGASVVVAIAGAAMALQRQGADVTRREIELWRQQAPHLAGSRAENARLKAAQAPGAELLRLQAEVAEVRRLRAEMEMLRDAAGAPKR